jgi:hypothetical protein
MTNFVRYDDGGNVIATGTMPSDMIAQQKGNILAVAAKIDRNAQYIANGSVCDYTPAELSAKSNMPCGWTWKMPERMAVDVRSDAQRAADALNAVLDARRAAYPDLCVFADAMYWSARGDGSKLVDYYSQVEAVKTANPKP